MSLKSAKMDTSKISAHCVASHAVTLISQRHSRIYLGHSSLQNNVPDGQRGCIKHRRHHYQHIRPACWTLSGKMQQNTDPVFVICRHRRQLTLNTAHTGEKKRVITTENISKS